MSQKLQNQVDELETKVKRMAEELEELNKLLHPITADTIEHKRRGRPPKIEGHMQPS